MVWMQVITVAHNAFAIDQEALDAREARKAYAKAVRCSVVENVENSTSFPSHQTKSFTHTPF